MAPNGIASYRPAFRGTEHMVVSGHYLAAAAGFRILEEGGNAIDAGVASGIGINVTLPGATSFAGVAPILVYRADRNEVVSISGLGRWPRAANLDDYTKRYGGDIPLGIPRSVVPSACDAWLTALERYGTMSFEQVVAPNLESTEKGFPISDSLAEAIEGSRDYVERCAGTAEVFMSRGVPLRVGEVVVQKDLARVFRQMVDVERANAHLGREGAIRAARDYFYKGEVAEKMVAFSRQEGGLLTMDDFAQFSVEVETPQAGTYRDHTLYTCGPWCQGPSLIQILNILEGFDLKAMGLGSAAYIHTVAEAIKLAFADRHQYYGDPDFVEVPMAGLNSKAYAEERRNAIDPHRAWPEMPPPGDPWPHEGKPGGRPVVAAAGSPGPVEPDTSYTCTVDRWGNAFSATPSDGFGSTPIVPGLGMIISPRGTQTWLNPEHPCALAPWKRPRLTPNPAMAFKDGKLLMPFGTPGGDAQVQAMVQMVLNMVEHGMDPQQAVEEPRICSDSFPNSFWPHVYHPGRLSVEGRIDGGVAAQLEDLGHRVNRLDDWTMGAGGLCGILVDGERGALVGGADPRRDSYAMGR